MHDWLFLIHLKHCFRCFVLLWNTYLKENKGWRRRHVDSHFHYFHGSNGCRLSCLIWSISGQSRQVRNPNLFYYWFSFRNWLFFINHLLKGHCSLTILRKNWVQKCLVLISNKNWSMGVEKLLTNYLSKWNGRTCRWIRVWEIYFSLASILILWALIWRNSNWWGRYQRLRFKAT